MMKKHILDSVKQECYVRLRPSKVCDGVGVFAIKPIPKGTVLFSDCIPDKDFVRWDQLSDVSTEVIGYLKSICKTNDEGLYLSQTVNNINLSYYINHSLMPNTFYDLTLNRYISLLHINVGEEILYKYPEERINWND